MSIVKSITELEKLYPQPAQASFIKVAKTLTQQYRKWIEASRFCVIGTVGPDGTNTSPRGDDGPVVRELDQSTIAMPDWRGNNLLDCLRDIVQDGRVSLMFMIRGSDNVVRVNGTAELTTDADLIAGFSDAGRRPRTVIVIRINEIYNQCARALKRAELWTGTANVDVPSPGDILTEMSAGDVDGKAYDRDWPARAAKTMY